MEKTVKTRLIEKIKRNKKYKTLSDSIVQKEIEQYFKRYPQLKSKDIKKNELKKLVKETRKKLHRIYASYQTKNKRKGEDYHSELKVAVENKDNIKIKEIVKKILATTIATKERLNEYEKIYQNIFRIACAPKTIVDLGAGLNPVSFPFMNLSSLTYYAYDIDEADIEFLNQYFTIMKNQGLVGIAEIKDIRSINSKVLPSADIIFMFKLIDLIDTKKKKYSRMLIQDLFEKDKTEYIVASFATQTLTRKKMNLPRRIGFEKMLKQLGLQFTSFSIENEIFYMIQK